MRGDLSPAYPERFFYNLTGEPGERYTLYALSEAPEAFSRFSMPRNTAISGPAFHGEGHRLLR